MSFADRAPGYVDRINAALERTLPPSTRHPARLHEAMRYAVLSGGKRVRPLLVYATGETLAIESGVLDVPAMAIELIHAFSLVHDDLPAMDDDDLRRGRPTVHRRFDEATAILAADALQPLAFEILGRAAATHGDPARWAEAVSVVAAACGSLGMTGGQSIDLAAEGRRLDRDELETMHAMKTGCLIRASVESVCCLAPACSPAERSALVRFGDSIGLAFQVKDDILDVEGETDVIGKTAGADEARGKATWPALFGLDEARRRCDELMDGALAALDAFGARAEPLRWMAGYIIQRHR